MSNSQYQTFEAYGTQPALDPRTDLHNMETPAYGGYVPPPAYEAAAPPAYEDTYRPAYEVPEPVLPRPAGSVTGADPTEPGAHATAGRRAGARARRARCTERVDGTVRRLLPQALVVAFLAGGTTAFVAEDKAIELSVDGRPRTLHTFADDVTELLAEEGVRVRAHDVIVPAPGEALDSGDEVAVRYGRPVRLMLDGQRREVWTTAHTVEEALQQLGVRAEGAYLSASRSRRIGREGLALDVRTERSVTVMADGRARTIRTNAATVREAVAQAGITLRGQDATSVAPESFPRDGQTVSVLRITGTKEIREELIPFEVERTEDPSLFQGTEVVERPGQPGLRRVTYSVRTVNGVRKKPRWVGTEVVREPRAQVVKVGTRPLPDSVQSADQLNWQGLAACESGGSPERSTPPGRTAGSTSSTRRPGTVSEGRDGRRTRRRPSRRSGRRSCTCSRGPVRGRTAGDGCTAEPPAAGRPAGRPCRVPPVP